MILINLIVFPISLFPHFSGIYRMSYSRHGFFSPKPLISTETAQKQQKTPKSFRSFSGNRFDFFISSCPKPIYSINLCTVSHLRWHLDGGTTFKLNSMFQITGIKQRNGLFFFSVFLKFVPQMKFEWWLMTHIRIVNNNEMNWWQLSLSSL